MNFNIKPAEYLLAYKTWEHIGGQAHRGLYGNIWRKIPYEQREKYRQHHWYIENWSEKKVNQLKAENKAKKLDYINRRNKVRPESEPYKSLFWPLVAMYGLRHARVIDVEVYCSNLDHNGNGFGNGKVALVFVQLHDPENAIGIIMDRNPMHREANQVERIPVHFREFHWLENDELMDWLNNISKYGRGYFYARYK